MVKRYVEDTKSLVHGRRKVLQVGGTQSLALPVWFLGGLGMPPQENLQK